MIYDEEFLHMQYEGDEEYSVEDSMTREYGSDWETAFEGDPDAIWNID